MLEGNLGLRAWLQRFEGLNEGFGQRLPVGGSKKVGEVVRRWGVTAPRRQTGRLRRTLKEERHRYIKDMGELVQAASAFAAH